MKTRKSMKLTNITILSTMLFAMTFDASASESVQPSKDTELLSMTERKLIRTAVHQRSEIGRCSVAISYNNSGDKVGYTVAIGSETPKVLNRAEAAQVLRSAISTELCDTSTYFVAEPFLKMSDIDLTRKAIAHSIGDCSVSYHGFGVRYFTYDGDVYEDDITLYRLRLKGQKKIVDQNAVNNIGKMLRKMISEGKCDPKDV